MGTKGIEHEETSSAPERQRKQVEESHSQHIFCTPGSELPLCGYQTFSHSLEKHLSSVRRILRGTL